MIERLAGFACSLDATNRRERGERWRAVEARASGRTEHGLVFPADPGLAAELAELAFLETDCCEARFRLDITAETIRLALTPQTGG